MPNLLVSIDTATGTPTTIGPTGASNILDAAFDPTTNTLFAAVNNGVNDELVTIDTATGAVASLGPTSFNLQGITFSPTGVLFGVENSDLVTIDPNTLEGTVVGDIGVNLGTSSSSGLSFDLSNNTILGHDSGFGLPEQLVAIDPETGAGALVGGPIGSPIDALVFVPNPIPEPTTYFLLVVSSAVGLIGRRSSAAGKVGRLP